MARDSQAGYEVLEADRRLKTYYVTMAKDAEDEGLLPQYRANFLLKKQVRYFIQ